ncbi:hypothetical protein ACHAXT_001155 [Thalassiosira profunda]
MARIRGDNPRRRQKPPQPHHPAPSGVKAGLVALVGVCYAACATVFAPVGIYQAANAARGWDATANVIEQSNVLLLDSPTGEYEMEIYGIVSTAVLPGETGEGSLDDAAYIPASVMGTIFEDVDGDSIRDASESGVPNVDVIVHDGLGSPVAIATTDAIGRYNVTGLPPGAYYAVVDPPSSYSLSPVDRESVDGSDFDPNDDRKTIEVSLQSGDVDSTNFDGGLHKDPAAIPILPLTRSFSAGARAYFVGIGGNGNGYGGDDGGGGGWGRSFDRIQGLAQALQESAQQHFLYNIANNVWSVVAQALRLGGHGDLGAPAQDASSAAPIEQQLLVSFGGKTYAVDASLSGSPSELKEAIWDKTGVPPYLQKLVFDGRYLTEEAPLACFGLQHLSALKVELGLRGGAQQVQFGDSQSGDCLGDGRCIARAGITDLLRLGHDLEFDGVPAPDGVDFRNDNSLESRTFISRAWLTWARTWHHFVVNHEDPEFRAIHNPQDDDDVGELDLWLVETEHAVESGALLGITAPRDLWGDERLLRGLAIHHQVNVEVYATGSGLVEPIHEDSAFEDTIRLAHLNDHENKGLHYDLNFPGSVYTASGEPSEDGQLKSPPEEDVRLSHMRHPNPSPELEAWDPRSGKPPSNWREKGKYHPALQRIQEGVERHRQMARKDSHYDKSVKKDHEIEAVHHSTAELPWWIDPLLPASEIPILWFNYPSLEQARSLHSMEQSTFSARRSDGTLIEATPRMVEEYLPPGMYKFSIKVDRIFAAFPAYHSEGILSVFGEEKAERLQSSWNDNVLAPIVDIADTSIMIVGGDAATAYWEIFDADDSTFAEFEQEVDNGNHPKVGGLQVHSSAIYNKLFHSNMQQKLQKLDSVATAFVRLFRGLGDFVSTYGQGFYDANSELFQLMQEKFLAGCKLGGETAGCMRSEAAMHYAICTAVDGMDREDALQSVEDHYGEPHRSLLEGSMKGGKIVGRITGDKRTEAKIYFAERRAEGLSEADALEAVKTLSKEHHGLLEGSMKGGEIGGVTKGEMKKEAAALFAVCTAVGKDDAEALEFIRTELSDSHHNLYKQWIDGPGGLSALVPKALAKRDANKPLTEREQKALDRHDNTLGKRAEAMKIVKAKEEAGLELDDTDKQWRQKETAAHKKRIETVKANMSAKVAESDDLFSMDLHCPECGNGKSCPINLTRTKPYEHKCENTAQCPRGEDGRLQNRVFIAHPPKCHKRSSVDVEKHGRHFVIKKNGSTWRCGREEWCRKRGLPIETCGHRNPKSADWCEVCVKKPIPLPERKKTKPKAKPQTKPKAKPQTKRKTKRKTEPQTKRKRPKANSQEKKTKRAKK